MRQCFFYEGKQLKTDLGHFVLTQSKLDSHHYALQRIQNCPQNYVFQAYSSFEDNHFLRYYTCWEQQQSVAKKVQKQQTADLKAPKKKSMGLSSFLSKKKAEISDPSTTKTQATKSKKELELKKQQLVRVKVIYVQLQGFQHLQLPLQISQIKSLMALIYVLAQAVYKANKFWPYMVPVQAGDGTIRFVKKGTNRDQQLVNLFKYLMRDQPIENWSKQMESIYEMYTINGQVELLGLRIHHDLSAILNVEYEIVVVSQGKKKGEKAKIAEPGIIWLVECGKKIEIEEYNVIFSYIDENSREVTLEHYIQNEIVVIGQSSNFIIRYLKTFRVK